MKEQHSLLSQPVVYTSTNIPVVPTSTVAPVYKNCILYEEGSEMFFKLSNNKYTKYKAKFRYRVVKNDLEYIKEFILDDKIIGIVLDCDGKITVDFLTYLCYKQYFDEGNNDHIKIDGVNLYFKEGY